MRPGPGCRRRGGGDQGDARSIEGVRGLPKPRRATEVEVKTGLICTRVVLERRRPKVVGRVNANGPEAPAFLQGDLQRSGRAGPTARPGRHQGGPVAPARPNNGRMGKVAWANMFLASSIPWAHFVSRMCSPVAYEP